MQADRDEFLDGPKESVQMSEEDYLPHGVIELLNDTRTRANSGINKLRNLEAYDPDLTDDVVDAAKRGRAALAEAGVPTQRGTSTVYQEGVGGISWQSPSYAEHLINSMPDGNEQNFAMNVRQARIVMDVNYEKFVNRLHAFTRKHKNAPTKKQLDAEAEDLRESIFVLNELARLGPDHPVAGRKESFLSTATEQTAVSMRRSCIVVLAQHLWSLKVLLERLLAPLRIGFRSESH